MARSFRQLKAIPIRSFSLSLMVSINSALYECPNLGLCFHFVGIGRVI